MSGKNKNSLQRALRELDKKNRFQRFDSFFVQHMLEEETGSITLELRKEAYRKFRERTGNREFASVPTMQKWFGIGGYTRPRRSQIYEISFFLELGVNELELFLTIGLREPSVQINDYMEAIFVYGLENGLNYEECMDMIWEFEQNLDEDFEISHSQDTQELLKEFQSKKSLSSDEFMNWMTDHADAFKGYSNTARNYLLKFKHIICKFVRQDMEEYLQELLADAGYDAWLKVRWFHKKSSGESIRKFIYTNKELSEEYRKEILRLVQCVYFEEDTNVRLLSTVFSASRHQNYEFMNLGKLYRMSEKHLSDLLNVASQKERDIRTAQVETVLWRKKEDDGNKKCPEWIRAFIYECMDESGKEIIPELLTVKEAHRLIREYRREHRRRIVLVQRNDLLPLAMYVAQQRYLESIGFNMEKYIPEMAKNEFVILADQTLAACNMARVSEEYELDAVLLACFQEDEMYSYSEVLEMVGRM